MPGDLTTALGRLLADRGLRETLRRDASEAARRLGVDAGELRTLDPVALEVQAQSLVDKRRHEVAKRLPRTMTLLGERGASLFRDYADGFWPEGHLRHLRDAVRFVEFLAGRGLPHSESEGRRVRFAAGEHRLSVGMTRDAWIGGRARRAVEIHVRVGGGVRSYALYLGI